MRLASFGPVSIVAAHPVSYLVIRTYKTLLSTKRHKKNGGKIFPRAQTMSDVVVSIATFPVLYFDIRAYKTLVSK